MKIGGLVALALFVALFGAFGTSARTTLANPGQASALDPAPLTVTPNAFASGATVKIYAAFLDDDGGASGQATITATGAVCGTPCTNPQLTFSACTYDADNGGALYDEVLGNCNGSAGDDCPTPLGLTPDNVFCYSAARVNLIDADAGADPFALTVNMVATCTGLTAVPITITSTQNGVTLTTSAVCNPAAVAATANTITLSKVDQLGAKASATFSIQAGGGCTGTVPTATCGTWTELGRAALTGSTGTGITTTNPCVVPSQTNCNTPYTSGTTTLPNGIIRIVEVIQPSNCTLVEVRDGAGLLVAPFAGGVQVNNTGITATTFTFVNSCFLAGTPSTAGSNLAVVVGGSSFGVSNRANVEIYPQPGSDDDARVDIRVRDSNNIPVSNAHVTILVDKGAIAIRQNTAVVAPTGYDVVEPSAGNFGTIYGGDTCDQLITQSQTSGSFTVPFIGIPGYGANPAFPQGVDGWTNLDGILSACIYVNPDFAPTITPGDIKITAIVEAPPFSSCASFLDPTCANYATNIVLVGTLKVVGPPASITVAASPTTLNCGEKSTITVTIKDSAGQAVSDHTQVELVTNIGGVIGGTGSTLGFPGIPPTGPQSSGAAETFGGVATAFLLTSTGNTGPYEVVAAAGGSLGSWVEGNYNNILAQILSGSTVAGNPAYNNLSGFFQSGSFAGGGVPSGAPVASQVTVNCSVPQAAAPVAPAVTAPRTGTGPSILPPNTGDAGLAAGTSSSTSLFTIAGVAVFALAGLATLKFARR